MQKQLSGTAVDNISLEPSSNNTVPCIAYASYKILNQKTYSNIVMAHSDHLIFKEVEFLDKINLALEYIVSNDALVTLGISPTRADTGYGYINLDKEEIDGVHKANSFLEKPINYITSGDYLWNTGIFI
jgi:mannose-1-phosphate guanylyltransferase